MVHELTSYAIKIGDVSYNHNSSCICKFTLNFSDIRC